MKKKFKSLLMCMLTVCMLFGTTSIVLAGPGPANDGYGSTCAHKFQKVGNRIDKETDRMLTIFRCTKCGYVKAE
ncbi:hypothetical protein [Clostridium ihumii]|uniref:hypothetical protein n=1 Tax=Clostridium ihumii TaxID=1470356 RepID=UPI00058AFAB2|nr:hypothetical protein [Clostridium ihumii]